VEGRARSRPRLMPQQLHPQGEPCDRDQQVAVLTTATIEITTLRLDKRQPFTMMVNGSNPPTGAIRPRAVADAFEARFQRFGGRQLGLAEAGRGPRRWQGAGGSNSKRASLGPAFLRVSGPFCPPATFGLRQRAELDEQCRSWAGKVDFVWACGAYLLINFPSMIEYAVG
jgi:hypothetical protein